MSFFIPVILCNKIVAEDLPIFFDVGNSERALLVGNEDEGDLQDGGLALRAAELSRSGTALAIEGRQKRDFAAIMNAVRTLQKALSLLHVPDHRYQIAAIQGNLGNALVLLGHLQNDETILAEAVTILRSTLASMERQQNMELVAISQKNLTFALMPSAASSKNEVHGNEAIDHFNRESTTLEETEESEPAGSMRYHSERSVSDEPPPSSESDQIEIGSDGTEDGDPSPPDASAELGDETVNSAFEVSLYGSVEISAVTGRNDILKDGGDGYGYEFIFDPEVNIVASYLTDLGLDYGASVSFDVDQISGSTSVLYFSGGFGDLRFGRDSGAEDDIYIGGGDFQAGSGGIDGNAANLIDVGLTGSDDATKVSYYTPRKRGFQVGMSFTPDTADEAIDSDDLDDDGADDGRFENHLGLGVNWVAEVLGADMIASVVGSFGDAVAGDDLSSYSIGSGLTLGRLQLGAGYTAETSFNDRDLLNFGITYGFDPWFEGLGESYLGAGIAFQFPENATSSTVFALSGDVEVPAGVRLLGDIAYNRQDRRSLSGDVSSFSGVLAVALDY